MDKQRSVSLMNEFLMKDLVTGVDSSTVADTVVSLSITSRHEVGIYRDGEGKRNSSYCSYRGCNGEEMFGQIQKFVHYPGLGTLVFIKRFTKTRSSILNSSGPPCRDVLESYAQVSLICRFVIEVLPLTENAPVSCIRLMNMISICILIDSLSSSCCYVVKLPNNFEHQ